MSALSAPHFHNEEAAYAYVEARIWPEGATCPHCGGVDRIGKMGGKSTRVGTYKCYQCRKPFTVKIGTIFESSHVALHIWLQAMYLVAGSKKGISSNQLHRTLGVTLKTAWFMSHRIREAMRAGGLGLMGGDGARVEADETYIGQKADYDRQPKARGSAHKLRVVSLIDRGTGEARSFPANSMVRDEVAQIVRANLAKEAKLTTDESRLYSVVGKEFAARSIPTPSRASFRSSSAGCAASTSTAAKSTFTATLPSSISATATAPPPAAMMVIAPTACLVVSSASA